jgi:hypothetical protein
VLKETKINSNNNLNNRSVDVKRIIKQKTHLRNAKSPSERSKLFSLDDVNKLEKIIPQNEIEKFEKKFEALGHSKSSLENKYKSDCKLLTKRIGDQDEQLEYLTLQLKESEHKSKIFQFQVNEYKTEQKAYQRKLNETQGQIENLMKVIREKEQENKILVGQMGNLRKLVKHNAVPPMDSEVVKHIEKIRNEDSVASVKKETNEEGEEYEEEEDDNNISDS